MIAYAGAFEYASAFGFGVLSMLGPCTLILLPVHLSRLHHSRKRQLLFLLGIFSIFFLLGMLAALSGKLLTSFLGPSMYLVAGSIALLSGLSLLGIVRFPPLPVFAAHCPHHFFSGMLFGGAALGCIGPFFAPVLGILLLHGTSFISAGIMLSYAIGFLSPFAIVSMIAARKRFQKFFFTHLSLVHRISGGLLVGAAGYLFWIGVR